MKSRIKSRSKTAELIRTPSPSLAPNPLPNPTLHLALNRLRRIASSRKDLMEASEECWFDHEKLEVYREAIGFITWLSGLLEATVRVGEVKDQLDRAATSIP